MVEADVEGDRPALNSNVDVPSRNTLLLGSMSRQRRFRKDWDMTLRSSSKGARQSSFDRTAHLLRGFGIPPVTFNETVGVVDIVAEETASNSGSLKQLPVCSTELLFGESSLIFDAPLPRTAVATGAGTGYDFLYSLALFEKGYRVYGAAILGQRTSDKGADYITTESSVRRRPRKLHRRLLTGAAQRSSEKALQASKSNLASNTEAECLLNNGVRSDWSPPSF